MEAWKYGGEELKKWVWGFCNRGILKGRGMAREMERGGGSIKSEEGEWDKGKEI